MDSTKNTVPNVSTHTDQGTHERDIYQDALQRLDQAAKHTDVHPEVIERLKHPKSVVIVSIPVRMDDGSLRVFTGYRVRPDDSRGPTKGGLRFHPAGSASCPSVSSPKIGPARSAAGEAFPCLARTETQRRHLPESIVPGTPIMRSKLWSPGCPAPGSAIF